MKRYSTTRRKIDKSGIKVLSTTYYPEIPIGNSDKFIMSKDGDRLDNLAYKYYRDNTLWWVIAKANGIRGKLDVPKDIEIRIPGNIPQVLEDFDNLNK